MRNTGTMKCRGLLMMLPHTLLVASLTGCTIVHLSADPSDTPWLKQATDTAAVAALEVATDPKYSSTTQNAWRDADGIWHWTQGGANCEGPQLGVPTHCDEIVP